jgi:pimeloyl-ACP methyl ester carboxylesterase
LVLLHGGAVDARFFDPNIDALAARFHVVTPDLRGHGHTPDVDGPFTYESLAHDTVEFIEAVVGGPAHLVGHSVGAGVALHVALRRPDLVRGLVLISASFHHSGQIAVDEIDVDQVVAAFGASYGEVSPDGEEHYAVVVRKEIKMDQHEPALEVTDLAGVAARTLVMASDDDLITLEHRCAVPRHHERRTRGRPGHVSLPHAGETGRDHEDGPRLPRHRAGNADRTRASRYRRVRRRAAKSVTVE